MKRMSILLALLFSFGPVLAQEVERELQRAIQKEVATGNLKAAIADYQMILGRAGTNKAVAAQALIRMGDAHRKLGQAEARRIYERVVREFSEQEDAVAHARAALDALTPTRIPGAGRSARTVWSGADAMGSPSGDGRFFSLVDWDTGDLAIRDLVAGTTRRLTNKGTWAQSSDFAEFSVLSPDGRYVAYAWATQKPSEHYELRLMATNDGGASKPRVLDSGEWIQPGGWSADGQQLVYLRKPKEKTEEVMLVSLPDGKPRALKHGDRTLERPTISPDGKHVTYAAPAGPDTPERDIFVLPTDGGGPVAIPHAAADWQPFWTPDGAQLLFVSNRSGRPALWSLPMRSGKPSGPAELVERDVSSIMGVTRDRSIYHLRSADRTNVYVAGLDGSSAERQLFSELYLNESNSPAWSPDGQSVAHYATINPGARLAAKAIAIRQVKGGSIRTLVPPLRIATGVPAGLRWFADGRSLLVVTREENIFGFLRLDAASGAVERLMETPASNQGTNGPEISPDGRALFYVRQNTPTGGRSIVRRDLASGTEVELKSGWFSGIALSRDGRQLAYLGNETSSSSPKLVLALLPVEGGASRVLFEGEWPQSNRSNIITWDPPGQFVYFVRQESGVGTLWRVPAAGGSAEKTAVSFKGNMVSPHIHPDGKRVAFTGTERSPAEMWLLENYLPPAGRAKR
jgi:Tol biopolymer transport system component